MSILSHVLLAIMLLVISSDFAATAGAWASQLKLPGGSIAVVTPIIVLVAYILGAALGKNKQAVSHDLGIDTSVCGVSGLNF